MIRIICLLAVALLLTACGADRTGVVVVSRPESSVETETDPPEADGQDLLPYLGKWAGEVGILQEFMLDINGDAAPPSVLLSSEERGIYYFPMVWDVKDQRLVLLMNDEANRIEIILALQGETLLTGTFTQYGETSGVTLNKVSDMAESKAFYQIFGGAAGLRERIGQLEEYAEFTDDGTTIPFTYTLYQREESRKIIVRYDLDALTEGYADVELMTVLLDWVCDNFAHDGMSSMPQKRDMVSFVEYALKNDGVNCRGLSIILAELCRVYGIEAKHITCMPKETNFEDCHVVVHAYSQELDQWIMLDPTYRLILKNEAGQYMNLQMLRQSFLDDTAIVPNDNAGWNGTAFDTVYYRSYMAKNTFRFSCATDSFFGAEEGRDGNVQNMLVPDHYTEDSAQRTTTSERAFWALPKRNAAA